MSENAPLTLGARGGATNKSLVKLERQQRRISLKYRQGRTVGAFATGAKKISPPRQPTIKGGGIILWAIKSQIYKPINDLMRTSIQHWGQLCTAVLNVNRAF